MSLFGSLMGDVEDDPFFGSHMRHMRHMNNMMNSLFSDPFGMLGGGGPMAITGPRHSRGLMPFMPQMPSMTRIFPDLDGHMGNIGMGSSYSSRTVVMSSGPNGKPQVYSSSSSTKVGPNGVKETRKTLQDSRTGTKKMSIGHHIGDRAHVVEREQNVYSGDAEERQEYINIEEEEADEFNREFQMKANGGSARARLALPAPPMQPNTSSECHRRSLTVRPASRRPLRPPSSPLALPSSSRVREVYGGSHPHPQRHRHRQHKAARSPPTPEH